MNTKGKKFQNVIISAPVDEAFTPGQVLIPNRQAFQDAPNGLQLQQQYDLEPGKYQWQSRTVGQPWVNAGEPDVVLSTLTVSAQIIFEEQGGWQLIYLGE